MRCKIYFINDESNLILYLAARPSTATFAMPPPHHQLTAPQPPGMPNLRPSYPPPPRAPPQSKTPTSPSFPSSKPSSLSTTPAACPVAHSARRAKSSRPSRPPAPPTTPTASTSTSCFLNERDNVEYRNVTTPADVEAIFNNVTPRGGTPTGGRLHAIPGQEDAGGFG